MKPFSYFSIVVATSLMGYFFIIGLPKIASVSELGQKKLPIQMNLEKDLPQNKVIPETVSIDKRNTCNTLMSEKDFASGSDADLFLENCLKADTPVVQQNRINDTKTETLLEGIGAETSEVKLTKEELTVKCNDFMSRAKFESREAAEDFLKNCLAGK